ncbi:hypothetical protein PHA77_06990 [Edwardsiella tarda]|uniref:fimbrial protein n=1 Tax=Edwardsiella tarda TaxID=636 RepID=UPI0024451D30|nr:hypothetical protein [Edwardsiella tarda]WGE30347.1 hypothetical protein PHA77_06990 [Edwardsiella tarda]
MRRQRIPRLALWARLLLVLVLLGLAPALRASCYGGGYHRVVPLGWGDYSIGEDAPIGTVFYRQLVHGDLPYSISCNADSVHSGRMQLNFRVDEKNWSANGELIASPVAGVGVRFRTMRGDIFGSLSNHYTITYPRDNPSTIGPEETSFIVEFIKTGPVPVGGSFSGSNLPMVIIEAATGGANDWSPVTEIEFIGDMRLMIHAGTCQVANDRYTYTFPKQLGADFPALGATSEWLAAPVTLHRCSAFTRSHRNNGDYAESTASDPNAILAEVRDVHTTPSRVKLTLSPQTAVLDSNNGVIAIEQGEDAAIGLAIQLGWNNGSGSYQPLALANGVAELVAEPSPPVGAYDSTDFVYRLAARLIRTGAALKGGKIRAQLTYTVTYL